jgi:hypothetical protein
MNLNNLDVLQDILLNLVPEPGFNEVKITIKRFWLLAELIQANGRTLQSEIHDLTSGSIKEDLIE